MFLRWPSPEVKHQVRCLLGWCEWQLSTTRSYEVLAIQSVLWSRERNSKQITAPNPSVPWTLPHRSRGTYKPAQVLIQLTSKEHSTSDWIGRDSNTNSACSCSIVFPCRSQSFRNSSLFQRSTQHRTGSVVIATPIRPPAARSFSPTPRKPSATPASQL